MIDFESVVTLDFETDRIKARPHYPPNPVGVAIKYGNAPSRYVSWGHPSGNNSSLEAAVSELNTIRESGRPLLFHNAKFDVAVLEERVGFPQMPWQRIHDTMFLMFLADPHSRTIDLKSAAEDLLGWAPEERDMLAEWVWERRKQLKQILPDVKIGKQQGKPLATKRATGECLSLIPADLVEPYARGDTDRTYALFKHLYPLIVENGMQPAYNRERQILPIFMENEREGLRVDQELLAYELEGYRGEYEIVDDWLRKRLKSPSLNIDSDAEFAEALALNGVVPDSAWTFTATGKRSVSKKNLTPDMYKDKEVAAAFGYRNRLITAMSMFMEPWAQQASENGGRVSTNWNQTRGEGGGTRTGRPSTSKPNFLNISKEFEGRTDGYEHPDFLDVEHLPLVRKYILPDEGHVFTHRDFSGQELRVFAHFERGELLRAYLDNPQLDVHGMIGAKMSAMSGKEYERTRVKTVGFQALYGGGIPALMQELNISKAEAEELKEFHSKALPGRVILNEQIKTITNLGEAIRTWGGRMYYPEPPVYSKKFGRHMDFGYKLINYLIQGSAADATKEAIIRWRNHPDRDPSDRFLVTVYDEINISAHPARLNKALSVLRECMEGLEFDVKMLSDVKLGLSWGSCVKPAKGEAEEQFVARFIEENKGVANGQHS